MAAGRSQRRRLAKRRKTQQVCDGSATKSASLVAVNDKQHFKASVAPDSAIDLSAVDAEDGDEFLKAMGFAEFGSTKGKAVEGNVAGATRISKKQKYRQFLHQKNIYKIPLTKQDLESSSAVQSLDKEGGL